MGLEPGRLVRHHRIGRCVRLVEAVFSELFHEIEKLHGELFVIALLQRAGTKDLTVLGHLLGLFLAHRPAQQVGAAKRIAANNLRDLHDLFLIDDHAIGRRQAVFQVRVEIIDLLLALFAQDKIIHHTRAQRTWPVQREHRDNVFETIWLQLGQELLHALRFKLEDGRGIGLFQDCVGRWIIKAQGVEVRGEGRIHLTAIFDGQIDNGEVAQTQEVKLHQASLFHIVLVKL